MKIYGIGVGPGDPELLTLRACRILKEVEMIVAPRSRREKESLAWSVVKGIVEGRRDKPVVIQPVFPMIKDRDRKKLECLWRETAARVLKRGEKCRTIAFITLGDPSLYSTFYRFLRAIQHLLNKKEMKVEREIEREIEIEMEWEMEREMEIEVVPGITSFSACSALAKVPIAEGEESAAIISRVERTAKNFENIIYMKPVDMKRMKNLLKGEKCRAILGVRVGMQGQTIISGDLNEIPEPRDYFSILIIRRG